MENEDVRTTGVPLSESAYASVLNRIKAGASHSAQSYVSRVTEPYRMTGPVLPEAQR